MGAYLSDKSARAAIIDIGRRLYERGFVAGSDGNISVRTGENALWITPSGVSKGFMTEDMLVKTDLSGNILGGGGRFSSEAKMHFAAFRENPELRSLCHAHPVYATLLSMTETVLDLALLPEAVVNLGVVPVLGYTLPGSPELAEGMAPYFRTHNAALLAHHGASAWGTDPDQALFRMETLEHYAKLLYLSGLAGRGPGGEPKLSSLSPERVDALMALREHYGIHTGGRPRSL